MKEKGDSHLLCEAPEGPFRQKVAVTFFRHNRFLRESRTSVVEFEEPG